MRDRGAERVLRRTDVRGKLLAVAALAILILLAALLPGCATDREEERDREVDTDGDGVPDDEDPYPLRPNWGVGLSYLDDTRVSPHNYTVDLATPVDYGVLIVNNTGIVNDTFTLEVVTAPAGWSIECASTSVAIDAGGLTAVVLTYRAPSSGSAQSVRATLRAVSKSQLAVSATVTLILEITARDTTVAEKGDQVVVSYVLHDIDGEELDSGRLPATAGEPEAGPAGQLSYIEGFYLGILGMQWRETKTIRVPPELGYGADPEAHELGGETLFFTLTLDVLAPV